MPTEYRVSVDGFVPATLPASLSLTGLNRFLLSLGEDLKFSNTLEFNKFAQHVLFEWGRFCPLDLNLCLERWSEVISDIDAGRAVAAGISPIRTSWGGVSVLSYQHPAVEKYLAIRKGTYLAFEKHDQKREALRIIEGLGILLYREPKSTLISMVLASPGLSVQFNPGEEHCIIGVENLLVLENSVDPKGMDQDLIFIFEPKAIPVP